MQMKREKTLNKTPFHITLFAALLFLLACKPAVSSEGSCLERPSGPKCHSLINKHADLRGITFANKYDDDRLLEDIDLIARKFQALTSEANEIAPCISFSSQSYANVFKAMSASLSASIAGDEVDVIYPEGTLNREQEELLGRCRWDLGEVLIIVTDYMFSQPEKMKDGESLIGLISKIKPDDVSDNIACSLILSGLPQLQMLIDPANKYSIDRDIVKAEYRKCNFNVEANEYIGASGEFIEKKMMETARSNFSLLDQNITGFDEIFAP